MLHTTYRLLREANACRDRYMVFRRATRAKGYRGDQPIPLTECLDSNGLEDALWALRAVPPEETAQRDRLARLLTCDYAERVLPLFERIWPDDDRPAKAIEVLRRFANGQATQEEMTTAALAAEAVRATWTVADAEVAWAGWAAPWASAWAAVWAAEASGWAASPTAWAAPWASAWAAAWAAEASGWAASPTAWAVARAVARASARAAAWAAAWATAATDRPAPWAAAWAAEEAGRAAEAVARRWQENRLRFVLEAQP